MPDEEKLEHHKGMKISVSWILAIVGVKINFQLFLFCR
jgi:hypothetical protein